MSTQPHEITGRRTFLRRTALMAGLWGAQTLPPFLQSLGAQSIRAGNPLRIPPEWSGGSLKVAPNQLEIWPGYLTDVYSINGSVPGPTIRVRRGDNFSATVENHLDQEFVMHWHGILAPESMDGHPLYAVGPGESYSVDFKIDQPGSTSWYHSHTDMLTAEQVYRGVAGLFIVEDPAESSLGLPTGDRDIPLILADRKSNSQRQFDYSPSMMDLRLGYLGNIALVNGTPEAWLSVDNGVYRFRLLNGSNARVFKIALHDNHSFHIVGSDSGLLTEPIEVNSAWLAPGQRMEILIDFSSYSPGTGVQLNSLPFAANGGMSGYPQGIEMPLLQFYIDRETNTQLPIPETLASITPYNPNDAKRTRVFNLTSSNMQHLINDIMWDINRENFAVPWGELEIWEYRNLGSQPHPMHMHATMFQVMERNGSTDIRPEDKGWKDTVLVGAGETVKILIRFDSHPGLFMHHCHNLEHEDHGMMENFRVLPEPRLQVDIQSNQTHISWPGELEGWHLEMLDAQTGWQLVPEEPALVQGRWIVNRADNSESRLYRLIK